jgi:hypothetical protein
MSYSNSIAVVVATTDLNNDLSQYHAVIIGGTIAPLGRTATGILLNKPKIGEDAQVGYSGRLRYRAGAAVTAGVLLANVASGWFTTAVSGGYTVGRALDTVTSGSIGEGIFNFATVGLLNT